MSAADRADLEVQVQPEFWNERWSEGRIGFHGSMAHVSLKAHWPGLNLVDGARVLVPLCGKSLDLWWLAERGFEVTGVELATEACEQLFAERGVTPSVADRGPHREWTGGGVRVLQGNVFDLAETGWDAVWDRAALVALPQEMRRKYAELLASNLLPGASMLLVALVYPQHQRGGPPFSVDPDHVRTLYEGKFEVTSLSSEELDDNDRPPWPISWLRRDVWRLRRR